MSRTITCPYCSAVITNAKGRQVTCGDVNCRTKQNRLRVDKQRKNNPSGIKLSRVKYQRTEKFRKVHRVLTRRRYIKTRYAMRHHKPWSEYEVSKIFDTSLTGMELCSLLDRSLAAIEKARVRYKDVAPLGYYK